MEGSAVAWEEVARSHADAVFRAARGIAADDETAWDCVQEAFLTALRRGRAERPEEPVPWLCGVARNHARNAARSRRRRLAFLDGLRRRSEATAAASAPAEAAAHEDLKAALARLPATAREAVVLRYLAGMSFDEVAAAQRVTPAAAKARIHRGLGRLREILGAGAAVTLLVRSADAAGAAGGLGALAAAARTVATPAKSATRWLPLAAAAALLALCVPAAIFLAGRGAGTPAAPAPAVASASGAIQPSDVAADAGAAAPGSATPAPFAVASAPVAPGMSVVLRDLADGRPLGGIRVTLGGAGGRRVEVTTDAEGRFDLPSGAGRIVETEGGYRVVDRLGPDVNGGPTWMLRDVRVTGSLVGLDPLPDDCALRAFVPEDRAAPRDDPRSTIWLNEHHLSRFRDLGPPNPDGSFAVTLPAVRGTTLIASVPGRRPASVDVPLPRLPATEARVVLEVGAPAIRIRGVLRDEEGAPLRGVGVQAWATRRLSPAEWRRERPRCHGHVYTASSGVKGATVNYSAHSWPGSRGELGPGEFDLALNVEGEVLLAVLPPRGYAPIFHRLGIVRESPEPVTLVARRVPDDRTVRIVRGRAPLAPGPLHCCDLSLGGPQIGFSLLVGEDGVAPAALLVRGHRYSIRPAFPESRYFVYEGQGEIDLDALPDRPPEGFIR